MAPYMPRDQRCVSHIGPAFSVGHSPNPHSWTLACSRVAYVVLVCYFNGVHPSPLIHVFRPRRDGRLSWSGWLTHSGHYTHSGHLSTIDQTQFRQSPPAKYWHPN